MSERICIVGSTAHSLINFRYDLIKLLKKKYTVITLSQDYNRNIHRILTKLKIEYISYGATGTSLVNEILSLFRIIKLLNFNQSFKVISFTLRANVFVGLASLINKNIKHYPMITGLGGVFLSKNENLFRYLFYKIFVYLIKFSLLPAKKIIFQNKSDKEFFKRVIINKKSVIIPGSGVNHKYYKLSTFPKKTTFMMISRFIKNKGIENFFSLSKKLKKNKNLRFILVGKSQKSFSLGKNFIKKNSKLSNIEVLNWKDDIRSLYKKCSVFVLPSRREGMSRSILEAMSCGKPIITTNVPGCRESVKDGFNGFLVKYNNNESLINAANKFIKNPLLIKKFGKNSRKRAIKYFNTELINKKMLKTIKF